MFNTNLLLNMQGWAAIRCSSIISSIAITGHRRGWPEGWDLGLVKHQNLLNAGPTQ